MTERPTARVRRGFARRHVYSILTIAALLGVIAFLLHRRPPPLGGPVTIDPIPAVGKVIVTLRGGEMTLQEVYADLATQAGTMIEPCWAPEAAEATFRPDRRVKFAMQRCSLDHALKMISEMSRADAIHEYESDRIIVGTSDYLYSSARAQLVVYPVADLVLVSSPLMSASVSEYRIEQLCALIRDTVKPDAWRENGGIIGSLRSIDDKLVITATPGMHREIELLLAALRNR